MLHREIHRAHTAHSPRSATCFRTPRQTLSSQMMRCPASTNNNNRSLFDETSNQFNTSPSAADLLDCVPVHALVQLHHSALLHLVGHLHADEPHLSLQHTTSNILNRFHPSNCTANTTRAPVCPRCLPPFLLYSCCPLLSRVLYQTLRYCSHDIGHNWDADWLIAEIDR